MRALIIIGARPHLERAPKNNGGAPSSCGRFVDFLLFFMQLRVDDFQIRSRYTHKEKKGYQRGRGGSPNSTTSLRTISNSLAPCVIPVLRVNPACVAETPAAVLLFAIALNRGHLNTSTTLLPMGLMSIRNILMLF